MFRHNVIETSRRWIESAASRGRSPQGSGCWPAFARYVFANKRTSRRGVPNNQYLVNYWYCWLCSRPEISVVGSIFGGVIVDSNFVTPKRGVLPACSIDEAIFQRDSLRGGQPLYCLGRWNGAIVLTNPRNLPSFNHVK